MMNDHDREIIASKIMMINQALSELPDSMKGLRPRELNYDHINVIVNTLLPLIRVDVRPFWASFNREWSIELQEIAKGIYQNESIHDRPIGQLISLPWYCAFMLANIQFNLAGSNSLDSAIASNTDSNIAHCAKLSQSNAHIMFQSIYGLNISGKKPSGCAAIIAFLAFLPLAGALILKLI